MSIRSVVKAKQSAQQQVPAGWEYIGEVNGKPRYRTTPAVSKVQPTQNVQPPVQMGVNFVVIRRDRPVIGATCECCDGLGRKKMKDGSMQKCFPCDGKGKYNLADQQFYDYRKATGQPISVIKYL